MSEEIEVDIDEISKALNNSGTVGNILDGFSLEELKKALPVNNEDVPSENSTDEIAAAEANRLAEDILKDNPELHNLFRRLRLAKEAYLEAAGTEQTALGKLTDDQHEELKELARFSKEGRLDWNDIFLGNRLEPLISSLKKDIGKLHNDDLDKILYSGYVLESTKLPPREVIGNDLDTDISEDNLLATDKPCPPVGSAFMDAIGSPPSKLPYTFVVDAKSYEHSQDTFTQRFIDDRYKNPDSIFYKGNSDMPAENPVIGDTGIGSDVLDKDFFSGISPDLEHDGFSAVYAIYKVINKSVYDFLPGLEQSRNKKKTRPDIDQESTTIVEEYNVAASDVITDKKEEISAERKNAWSNKVSEVEESSGTINEDIKTEEIIIKQFNHLISIVLLKEFFSSHKQYQCFRYRTT